ncbi:MAG: hypothetical protein J6Q38_00190 [Clostridia bacterium]|nr:hypothetical protein [Clostridia bacterium]
MKRNVLKKSLVIFAVITASLVAFSCKSGLDLSVYVSELRTGIYQGKSDGYDLIVYSEKRENPFKADGFVGDMKNLITVKLELEKGTLDGAEVKLQYDDYECEGDFEYSVLKGKYVSEIFVEKLPESPIIKAIVINSGEEVNIELKSQVFSGTVSYKNVLSAIEKSDPKIVNELFNTSSVSSEIHVRIISDNSKNYYYVGFVTKEGNTFAYLVDGESCKVLAKKEIKA